MEEKKEVPALFKLIFIFFPLLEFFIFLAAIELVGGEYVLGWTFLSIVIGYFGVKSNAFKKIPAQSQMLLIFRTDVAINDPEIISYYFLKIGYILLIVPGLVTDLIGILLTFPTLRAWASKKLCASKEKNERQKL